MKENKTIMVIEFIMCIISYSIGIYFAGRCSGRTIMEKKFYHLYRTGVMKVVDPETGTEFSNLVDALYFILKRK